MIAEKLQEVEEKIAAAKARRAPELTDDVTLVAVTKNHDVSAMQEALAAGVTNVGENRVQEAPVPTMAEPRWSPMYSRTKEAGAAVSSMGYGTTPVMAAQTAMYRTVQMARAEMMPIGMSCFGFFVSSAAVDKASKPR